MDRPKNDYWQNRHETLGSLFPHQKMAEKLFGKKLSKKEKQFIRNCYIYDYISNFQKNRLKLIYNRIFTKKLKYKTNKAISRMPEPCGAENAVGERRRDSSQASRIDVGIYNAKQANRPDAADLSNNTSVVELDNYRSQPRPNNSCNYRGCL